MSLPFAVSIDTVPNIMSLIVLLPIYLSFDFIIAVSIDTVQLSLYTLLRKILSIRYAIFQLRLLIQNISSKSYKQGATHFFLGRLAINIERLAATRIEELENKFGQQSASDVVAVRTCINVITVSIDTVSFEDGPPYKVIVL